MLKGNLKKWKNMIKFRVIKRKKKKSQRKVKRKMNQDRKVKKGKFQTKKSISIIKGQNIFTLVKHLPTILTIVTQTIQKRKPLIKCQSRKENITCSLKKLFNKNTIKMTPKSTHYPCYFENWNFQGKKLRRHLESKSHNLTPDTAKVQQSYLTRNVKFLTKISKTKQLENNIK